MRVGSLRRNLLFSGLGNASDLLVFALMILAGRMLGQEGFGVFSFAQALATVHLTFMNFGLDRLMVRDVARRKDRAWRYLVNVVWWKGVLAVASLLVLGVNAFLLMQMSGEARAATLLVAGALTLRFFALSARTLFRAFERFDREAVVSLVEQSILLVLGAGVLLAGHGAVHLAAAFLLARAISCLYTFQAVGRLAPPRLELDARLVVRLQRQALPIGLGTFVTTAYVHVDTILIKALADFSDVGLYNAGLKVFMGLMIVPSIICQVWLPRLSTSLQHGGAEVRSMLVKGGALLLAAGGAIALGGLLAGDLVIVTLFGDAYADAVLPMQVLLGASILTFQVWYLRTYLVAADHQGSILVFSLLGLASRLAFDLLLIPRHGILGAAVATGLSEGIVLAAMLVYATRKRRSRALSTAEGGA